MAGMQSYIPRTAAPDSKKKKKKKLRGQGRTGRKKNGVVPWCSEYALNGMVGERRRRSGKRGKNSAPSLAELEAMYVVTFEEVSVDDLTSPAMADVKFLVVTREHSQGWKSEPNEDVVIIYDQQVGEVRLPRSAAGEKVAADVRRRRKIGQEVVVLKIDETGRARCLGVVERLRGAVKKLLGFGRKRMSFVKELLGLVQKLPGRVTKFLGCVKRYLGRVSGKIPGEKKERDAATGGEEESPKQGSARWRDWRPKANNRANRRLAKTRSKRNERRVLKRKKQGKQREQRRRDSIKSPVPPSGEPEGWWDKADVGTEYWKLSESAYKKQLKKLWEAGPYLTPVGTCEQVRP